VSGALLRGVPLVLIALGLAGSGLGAYLTIAHFGDTPLVCGGVGDCGYVQSSEYAGVGGVPVSALGLLLYVTMTAVAGAWVRFRNVEWLPVAYWGLALAGAGYAAYLTYVEIFLLQAICVWCVVSAVLLGLSLLFATYAVFHEPDDGAGRTSTLQGNAISG
jgi:uncharacterized membrane protein